MKKTTIVSLFILIALVLIAYTTIAIQQSAHENETFRAVTDELLEWSDYQPPGFGPGLQVAVVQGDPSVHDEPYVIRASFTDGYIIPLHYHPRAENLTVLSGTFRLAKGENRDESMLKSYRAGDFLYIPGEHPHYGKVKGPTVIQLHGIGPFETIVLEEELAEEMD